MARLISPGILVKEIDLSNIVPSVSNSIGAVVGTATKGPIQGDEDSPTLITSQQQFIDTFGEPDGSINSYMHYAALQFLAAGNQLYVVRVPTTGALYSTARFGVYDGNDTTTSQDSGLSVSDVQDGSVSVGSPYLFRIYSKTPGAEGNNIGIVVINYTDWSKRGEHIVDSNPGFFFEDVPKNVKEFILAVYDYKTKTYVESFTVSREQGRKNLSGQSMYIEDRINNNSNWIRVKDHVMTTTDTTTEPGSTLAFIVGYPDATSLRDATAISILSLTGGDDGSTSATDAQLVAGWDEFSNSENIDVNILIQAGYQDEDTITTSVPNKMISIAESRGDCIAVLDIPYAEGTPMEAVNWKKRIFNPNTSYAALYWPWIKIFDRWTDKNVWVPPSTFVAYVYALTDFTRETWFAPAGLTRGKINVIDLQYKPSQGERDILYMANINPIAFFPGEGTAVWGQKTLQTKASALDRVNVRRLLLVLEKAIAKAAKYILFEPNDRFTRKLFVQIVEPFLRDVKGRRGIEYYKVVCDESNNPSDVINRNELIMDIFIQPIKAAEFIQLKFNILRTGVLSEEYVQSI